MDAIADALARHGYLIVFGWVLAEQIGLPLPAVPFLLAAGGLAGTGRLSFAVVLVAAGTASLISDTIWYWIGRRGGMRVLGWLCRISLEPDSCVRRTERNFSAHGAPSLLVAKFIPGFNTAAPPLAGIVRMPLATFVLFTAAGGLIWAGAWVALGWIFTDQLEIVAAYAQRLGGRVGFMIVAGFAAYIAYKYVARRRFLRKIRIARITPEELKRRLDAGENIVVVDVRDRLDFDAEPTIIPGALHLATDELDARYREIPRERDIVLYCT
ncbi:MAG TPA: VTT domain-containing protein [Methylomirabilota bacterium]|jgi:membrane protein DedA with SNARE-associated domain|nr:VTT domain-containing protein [Methylomirabilota bacterium]